MSTTEPAEKAGTGPQKPQGFDLAAFSAELDDIGSANWADIMQVEHLTSGSGDEDKEESPKTVKGRRAFSEQPPYRAQVTNLSSKYPEEELYYFFGGNEAVKDITWMPEKGRAELELENLNALQTVLALNNTEFEGNIIKAYRMREPDRRSQDVRDTRESRDSTDGGRESYSRQSSYSQYQGHGSQISPAPGGMYSKQNSRYNSQSSIYSNDARSMQQHSNRGYHDRSDYRDNHNRQPRPAMGPPPVPQHPYNGQHPGGYNSLPRQSGRYPTHGQQDYGGRGGYGGPLGHGGRGGDRGHRGRGGHRGGAQGYSHYDNRGGPGELQRSGSYHHARPDRPAPMSRSRTDSSGFDRPDMGSRTSLATIDQQPDRPVPRNQDIFGDAQPVDSAARLREVEERQLKEKKLREEQAKEERERLAKEAAEAAEVAARAAQPESDAKQSAGHGGFTQPHPPPPRHHQGHHQGHHHKDQSGYQRYPSSHHPQGSTGGNESSHSVHNTPRFDGPPGTVEIKRRDSTEPAEVSPAIQDAAYQDRQMDDEVSRKTSSSEGVRDNAKPPFGPSGGQPAATQGVRTFTRSGGGLLQKSATIGQIGGPEHHRGSIRGRGRGGRGAGHGGRGAAQQQQGGKRRSSFSGEKERSDKDRPDKDRTDRPREDRKDYQQRPDRKEHHGSVSSLRGGRGGSMKRGGRQSRDAPDTVTAIGSSSVTSTESNQKMREEVLDKVTDIPKPAPVTDRSESKSKSSERSTSLKDEKPVSVAEKNEKVETAPPAPTPPVTETKKKEKKKSNKKSNESRGKHLDGNKFAVLCGEE